MSSLWTLRCRACREPLGDVRDGTLEPATPVVRLHPSGVADLRCPCGEVKPWKPPPRRESRAMLERA